MNVENKAPEYVLINESEIVTSYDDLEEEIFMILEEDPEMEIKVYLATERLLSLDAEYIVESLYDDDLIAEYSEIPSDSMKELQSYLDKWCKKIQKTTSTTFEVGVEELNVDEIISKVKSELAEQ